MRKNNSFFEVPKILNFCSPEKKDEEYKVLEPGETK